MSTQRSHRKQDRELMAETRYTAGMTPTIAESLDLTPDTSAATITDILTFLGLTITSTRDASGTPVTIWHDPEQTVTVKVTPHTVKCYNGAKERKGRHTYDAGIIHTHTGAWLNTTSEGDSPAHGIIAALVPFLIELGDSSPALVQDVVLVGGQPSMTGPWADTAVPMVSGGSQDADEEGCRICGDTLTQSEAGVCTRCYGSRERRLSYASHCADCGVSSLDAIVTIAPFGDHAKRCFSCENAYLTVVNAS